MTIKCAKCNDIIKYMPNELVMNCGGNFNDGNNSTKRITLCNKCMHRINNFMFYDERKTTYNIWNSSDMVH